MPKKAKARRDGIYTRRDRDGYWGGWEDAQGRWVQRKLKGASTLLQARAVLAEEKRKVEEQLKFGKPLPTEDTFEAFAVEFLKSQKRRISLEVIKGKISEAEFVRQRGIIENHFIGNKGHFRGMKLGSVRKSHVIEYIYKRIGVVSDATVIKETNTLKKLFAVAVDLEKIAANPAAKVMLPKAPDGRNRWLRVEEWHRLFSACALHETDWSAASRIGKLNKKRKAEGLAAIVPIEQKPLPPESQWLQQAAALAVSLGTRRGELLHISLPDIDLDRRTILLRRTKNGKPRLAFINDSAMLVLGVMRVRERKERGDFGVLFVGITPQQLSVAFARAVKRAGIEDFSLHDLRHCYASHLRMNGADLHDLMVLLGHSDMRMTVRYSHLSNEHLASTAQRLNGVLTLPTNSGAFVTVS